jgi:hypothetical protein
MPEKQMDKDRGVLHAARFGVGLIQPPFPLTVGDHEKAKADVFCNGYAVFAWDEVALAA